MSDGKPLDSTNVAKVFQTDNTLTKGYCTNENNRSYFAMNIGFVIDYFDQLIKENVGFFIKLHNNLFRTTVSYKSFISIFYWILHCDEKRLLS